MALSQSLVRTAPAAVPCLLSPLYFAFEPAAWLVPAGRFPGLVATTAAGMHLAHREPTRRPLLSR